MDFRQLALDEGFLHAHVLPTEQIPFEEMFRVYCEENVCGQYGVNYACPPACGTFSQMRQRILDRKNALVVQTVWNIPDYTDAQAIRGAKQDHNAGMFRLMERLQGRNCLMAGASGCSLCTPCAMGQGQPCRFPDRQYSCMSAYCIHVKQLADLCGMAYLPGPGKVAFFGLIAFD